MIVDEGAARVNYHAIEIESEQSNCFSINILVVQKFNLNPLQRHFKNTKKRPLVHAATLLTIYHRIVSSVANQRTEFVIER